MDAFKNAEWIMADAENKEIVDRAFIYTTNFNLFSPTVCQLYISSHSQYAIYVNGQFVDCGQYSGYEDYQVYDILDISAFVHTGENTLYVWHYVSGENFSTCTKQIPGVIFSIYNDGRCVLNSNCKCLSAEDKRLLGLREKITVQLGYTWDFDSTASIGEFKPSVLTDKKKQLYPRPIKKLINSAYPEGKLIRTGTFKDGNRCQPKSKRMQFATLNENVSGDFATDVDKRVSWSTDNATSDGAYLLYDCDECAGFVSFSFDLPIECEILIGFGEHLDDGRVRTTIGSRNFCLRYIAHAGTNTFAFPMLRIGLRYLSFYVYSHTGTVNYAGIVKQTYPLSTKKAIFKNELHQKIYDIGCNTLSLCMHEHYEDCPWREQALFMMDSRVQMLCGYYAFGEYNFPAASLRLAAHSLRPDGLLELCPPGKVFVNIPSFTAVYVRMVLEYVQYSGDISLIDDVFCVLQTIIEAFADRLSTNGLIYRYEGKEYWNFYEWSKGLAGELDGEAPTPPNTVDAPLNAFVCDAFLCFAEICKLMHRDEQAEKYLALNRTMKEQMHKTFWNEENQAYSTYIDEEPKHLLTQSLMLFVNAVPQDKIQIIAKTITEKRLIDYSLSMSIYIYEALLKTDDAYRGFVLTDIENTWKKMLDAGCQTFWETALGADDFGKAGSLCHGWSAVPIYIWGKYFNLL